MAKARKKFAWGENILAPVTVNLLTAFLIFMIVALFKQPLKDYFFEPGGYPLYCVAEPYENPSDPGRMNVDFFVINLTNDLWTRDQISDFLRKAENNDLVRAWSPELRLTPKRGAKLRPTIDLDFNAAKGRLGLRPASEDSPDWIISVDEIQPNAILRVQISTDQPIRSFGRNDRFAVPFEVDYPGVKQVGW